MLHKPHTKGGEPMTENIISIRKTDQFYLCKGSVSKSGEVIEKERVGRAYLKPNATMFRLKLWMLPKGEYFLAREENGHFQYLALCREEFEVSPEGHKNQWHKIGSGEVIGNFIRIRLHLLSEDIYLCLFPNEAKRAEVLDAA